MAQRYALPLAQAYKQANDVMNPETAGLQEQLASQSMAGMQTGMTAPEAEQYRSDLAGQLGTNVGSGVGADYMSRNMLLANQQRGDYWRNLGLSVAGRQPLTTAQPVNSLNYMQNYTPTANANFVGQGYGNYSNAYSSMYNANANATASKNAMMGQMAGGAMGAAGSMGGAMILASSRELKDNIVEKDINALDIVDTLKPMEFNYKGEEEKTYGFISEDSHDLITAKDKKAVNAYSCIGLLTKAVQELRAEIKALKGA
jgi:hypothetical protein